MEPVKRICELINSLKPRNIYLLQWASRSMMSSLFDAKPSSEPMLQYFKQLSLWVSLRNLYNRPGSICLDFFVCFPLFLNNTMWKNIQPILRIQVQYNELKYSYDQ